MSRTTLHHTCCCRFEVKAMHGLQCFALNTSWEKSEIAFHSLSTVRNTFKQINSKNKIDPFSVQSLQGQVLGLKLSPDTSKWRVKCRIDVWSNFVLSSYLWLMYGAFFLYMEQFRVIKLSMKLMYGAILGYQVLYEIDVLRNFLMYEAILGYQALYEIDVWSNFGLSSSLWNWCVCAIFLCMEQFWVIKLSMKLMYGAIFYVWSNFVLSSSLWNWCMEPFWVIKFSMKLMYGAILGYQVLYEIDVWSNFGLSSSLWNWCMEQFWGYQALYEIDVWSNFGLSSSLWNWCMEQFWVIKLSMKLMYGAILGYQALYEMMYGAILCHQALFEIDVWSNFVLSSSLWNWCMEQFFYVWSNFVLSSSLWNWCM